MYWNEVENLWAIEFCTKIFVKHTHSHKQKEKGEAETLKKDYAIPGVGIHGNDENKICHIGKVLLRNGRNRAMPLPNEK